MAARAGLAARLAWAHEYETTGVINVAFPSLPGSSFTVDGAPMPSDIGIARLVAEIELDKGWSLRLQADGEFADRYGSFAGSARIAARW